MANKQFLLQLAGTQMKTAGMLLEMQDADDKGTDDVLGHVLEAGGGAVLAFSGGNIKGANGYLKTLADGINAYLATQGTG
jgi:hypothetical protein